MLCFKVMDTERFFAPDPVGSADDLGFHEFCHVVVQDDIGGFLQILTGPVLHAVEEKDAGRTVLERFNSATARVGTSMEFPIGDVHVLEDLSDTMESLVVRRKDDEAPTVMVAAVVVITLEDVSEDIDL